MSAVVEKVLVIGGGTAGMAAAIELRKAGVEVDLLEISRDWQPDGAGISVNGPMMRCLHRLGLLERFLAEGHAGDGVVMRSPAGNILATVPTPGVAGTGVPGSGAIMRSTLARIMADKVKESGANVILGQTYSSLTQDADGVEVIRQDGTKSRYDLVIVADGLYSSTRNTYFPEAAKPRYVGQAVWRAVLPRPSEVETTNIWLGQKGVKPGVNPVSNDHVYMFISEDVPDIMRIDPSTFVTRMKALLEPFSCPIAQRFREQICDDSLIVYRPLEGMINLDPWFKGRIAMIGDTVHGTTPQLTAGAMMGIEDGMVIAEEVGKGGRVDEILTRFFTRRVDRCRMVVENSGRLNEIEIAGGSEEEYARIWRESAQALAQLP